MCYRHSDRPTALSCTRCGRPACSECLRPAAVGAHCVDCVRDDGATQVRRPTFGDGGLRPITVTRNRPARPLATYALLAINVAVFIACVISAGSLDVDLSPLLQHGELVRGSVVLGEYWRLVTAGFLHYSVLHLVVNMVSLYILGRDLENVLGTSRFVIVYGTSLLGGSAAVMVAQADTARSAGASGAIFGLMGAMLVVVLRLRVSPTPVLVIIGFNLVVSFSISGISLPAHVGGLIFGAAATAALIYGPLLLPRSVRTERNAAAFGWIAVTVLAGVAIAISVVIAQIHTGPILVYVPPLV